MPSRPVRPTDSAPSNPPQRGFLFSAKTLGSLAISSFYAGISDNVGIPYAFSCAKLTRKWVRTEYGESYIAWFIHLGRLLRIERIAFIGAFRV
jgi:hypothetical protein